MRVSFSVLFALILGLTVLTIVAISSFPTHPFIITFVMMATACVSLYTHDRVIKEPDFEPDLRTEIRTKYLLLKDAMCDPLSNLRLSLYCGLTVGMGASFVHAVLRGDGLATYFSVFFAAGMVGFVVTLGALVYYTRAMNRSAAG